MDKYQFVRSDTEGQLIHSEALEVRFMTAAIAVGADEANVPNAKITVALAGLSASQTIDFLKDTQGNNSEYFDSHNFTLTSRYTKFEVDFDRSQTETMLATELQFLDSLDQAYTGLSWQFGKYIFVVSQQLVKHSRDGMVLSITAFADPGQQTPPSIEDLIESVRAMEFIPVQLSFAVSTPDLPRKIYTNGANYYIDHPSFGRVPGGISYIDLSTWDGGCRVYDESDLRYFDGDDIELIHRPSLNVSFFRGTLKGNTDILERSNGDISLIIKNEFINDVFSETKLILDQNPEYDRAEGFRISHFFNRFSASFTDIQHLQSVAQFIDLIEKQLVGKRTSISGSQYEAEIRRKFLLEGSYQTTFNIRLHSPASRKTTLVDLKAALHEFAYLPLFQAIQIEASGLPTKLYTNTGVTWVSTEFSVGNLPSDMNYVALRSFGSESAWAGEDISFSAGVDIKNTGA
jgi:hypothetical protein